MNYTEVYGTSKWLKAVDLRGMEVTVKIQKITSETIGQGDDAKPKLIAHFDGKDKALVLNKTNSATIASVHGDETDDWTGAEVIIYPTTTSFGNDIVDCIRIRMPTKAAAEGEEPPF